MALAVQGHVASYLHKDFDLAFQRFEAALRVNPNAAPAWLWSAASHSWIGNGSRAVEEINRARALSPYDPLMYAYNSVAGMAYLADGQFERAVEFGLRSIGENRTYTSSFRLLVLACMLAGREFEIIAVDDDSADDTRNVCAQLAEKYSLRLIVRANAKDGPKALVEITVFILAIDG